MFLSLHVTFVSLLGIMCLMGGESTDISADMTVDCRLTYRSL